MEEPHEKYKSDLMHPLLLLIFFSIHANYADPDASYTRVFGPGLHPEKVVLPARYFFIHAFDEKNNPFQKSPGNVFSVEIKGTPAGTANHNRVWIQVLDRKDGFFIVRYKLYNTIQNAEIHVLLSGKHVAGSPYQTSGYSYSEECNCPSLALDDWLKQMNCSEYPQIGEDLKLFNRIKFSKLYPLIRQRFNQPESMSLCNFIVKNNQIYRRCFGKHVGFKMFMDAILLSLTRKIFLPDMEFFMNLGDWPLSPSAGRPAIPLFSWCGSDDTLDIHVPTYDLTQSSLQCMGSVMLDMLSVQTSVEHSWEERESKAFWRGRDSRAERLQLVSLSRENPDLLNASLTNFFFYRNKEETYGPKTEHISFFKFFDYKYQVNVDGTVAAYRMPYLLGGGSLLFKQESKYHEHFYNLLQPWKHYVPIRHDLSDLIERIHWARDNDNIAHKIALAGQQFAQDNLLPKDVFCYHGKLFQEWAKRLVEPVDLRDEMDLVPQPSESSNCFCEKSTFLPKDEL